MSTRIADPKEVSERSLPGGRAAVRIDALGKSFRRRRDTTVEALREVSLEVSAGEFVSIIGPSGCGKSTLLRVLAGIISPTAGSVSTSFRSGHPRIGMVFQDPVLLPWRTALDNVLLPIDLLKLKRNSYLERAERLLDQVGLAEFASRHPAELSGGMKQRVALCRSLIHDPDILLMDEPFSAVDEITRQQLNDLLQEVWSAAGKTVVFVTHSVPEAVYLSDRVVVLSARPGTVKRIEAIPLTRPRVEPTRYASDYIAHVRSIQEALRA